MGVPVEMDEVANVLLDEGFGLTWDDYGAGFTNDVVSGSTAGMHEGGGVFGAECLQSDVSGVGFMDPRPDPPAANGYYYLIRLRSECGYGAYGQTTDGDPRLPTNDCP